MLIITLRTDKPEAEISVYNDQKQLGDDMWLAHRQLAETLHIRIRALLETVDKKVEDVEGIIVYEGPGSFTGLRIGMTVANTLAYSLHIPIVTTSDPNWLEAGIDRLLDGDDDGIAVPQYGALPNITEQKK